MPSQSVRIRNLQSVRIRASGTSCGTVPADLVLNRNLSGLCLFAGSNLYMIVHVLIYALFCID